MSGKQSWECPGCGAMVKKRHNKICPHCSTGRHEKPRRKIGSGVSPEEPGVSPDVMKYFMITYPPEITGNGRRKK
jgi:hypothetical protein